MGRKRAKPYRGFVKIVFTSLLLCELAKKPDVVLAMCRIDYLKPIKHFGTPLVYIFHNPIEPGQEDDLHALGLSELRIIALTKSHARPLRDKSRARIVGNCVDFDHLQAGEGGDRSYLAFLGRLTENKGVDTAIAVARRTGLPLRIAGNLPTEEPGAQAFFDENINPELDDQIQWMGVVTEDQKANFLSKAKALLMPIRWDEPFGIVVPEAFACGTPVIATPCGSMPEIVCDGENGFLARTIDEFCNAVARLDELDASRWRPAARNRFGVKVTVEAYTNVLREVCRSQDKTGSRAT